MKRYFLIIIFIFSCSIIFATERANIRLSEHSQRNIKSNGITLYSILIVNEGNNVLYDLELSAINDDNLEIKFEKIKIFKLDPKESIRINVEINSKIKHYFDKDTFITYKISNNYYSNEFCYKYTIKPFEKFWFFTIISISLVLIILFVLMFIKLDKGEKNVG